MAEFILEACAIFLMANIYSINRQYPVHMTVWLAVITAFAAVQVMPFMGGRKYQTRQLRICKGGCRLLRLFLLSTAFSVVYSLAGYFGLLRAGSLPEEPKMWLVNTVIAILAEAAVFWNGMIRIYATSRQLGVKWRVIGALCGMIPVVHLAVLSVLIRIAEREADFENQKILRNQEREPEQICRTKYPLLMVHGVFFRDFRYFNYWGRVPKELIKNGAVIYYGNHQSAASVADSAQELTARIRQITEETGCEKVNIIAHSKGGLDCRYALAKCGIADRVASLTTVSTPHRGCEFADYLLSKIPQGQKDFVANAYNAALKKVGDENPDFMAAIYDLTAEACSKRNGEICDVPGVYYQSAGTVMTGAAGGRFPLNFSYHLVNYFDGRNDGLVGEASFPWGSQYRLVTSSGKRGISHGDIIDLNRENFDGFDVREFYVQLVHELKEKGF